MTTDERNSLRATVVDVMQLELEPLFDPRCRLTFVMRAPHLKDGDLVVSSDELPLALKALERLNGYKTEPVVETVNMTNVLNPPGFTDRAVDTMADEGCPNHIEPDAHLGAVEGRD